MNEHVDNLISAYIDHELGDTDRELFEQHIQTCNKCKGLLHDLTSIQQMIYSNYQAFEVSDSIEDLVMQKIFKDATAKEKAGYWFRHVFFIATIVALIAVLFPFLYFGGIITTFLHITISLISLVPIFIRSIPVLMAGIMFFAFILVLLSIWSLRNLLGGGWIEKHIT